MWILWSLISLTGGLTATYLAKLWIKTGNPWFIVGVLVGAIFSWVGWVAALRLERLTVVEGFFAAISIIILSGIGLFIFQEKVSIQEGIGIILAIFATILLVGKF